jgi:hypothetical protein
VIKGWGLPEVLGVIVKVAVEVPPPGRGLLTTTSQLPVAERSDAVSVIVSWPLLTNNAGCKMPLKVTVDEPMNPLPLIVNTSRPELTVADVGDKPVIDGWGLSAAVTVKLTDCELPPPGGGLFTMRGKVPTAARSEALRFILSWLLPTEESRWGTPLNITVDAAIKPVPLIVSVNGPVPTVADDGDRPVIAGCGLGKGWIASVTAFDVTPPLETMTGTAGPVAIPVGI